MVKEYHKKSYSTTRKYRSPKIYNPTKRDDKPKFKFSFRSFRLGLIFFGVVFLFYHFFFSVNFRITEFIVEGNVLIGSEAIVETLPKNQNIFLLDIDSIKEKILIKFPEIKQVEIYRGIPDAIKIVVLERENKIVWQTNNELYFVSLEGTTTRRISPGEAVGLPKVIDLRNLPVAQGIVLTSQNFVAFITNVYSEFQTITGIKPLDFEVDETTFDVKLRTEAGFYVKLNSLRSSTKQLSDLKLILDTKRAEVTEYVDLRIDGWAYYK